MTPLSAHEQATLERIEAAPDAEESLRERVARAMWESDDRALLWEELHPNGYGRDLYRGLATAAIAVMRGQS